MSCPGVDSPEELLQLGHGGSGARRLWDKEALGQGRSPRLARSKGDARKCQPGHQDLSLFKTASLAAIR